MRIKGMAVLKLSASIVALALAQNIEAQVTLPASPAIPATGTTLQTPAAQETVADDGTAAQADASPPNDIVVTGSRIVRDGYNSPTPVTVLSSESLAKSAPSNIPDALNQLPQFQSSQSPATRQRSTIQTQVQVGNYLNLRGLSPQRTLVLLDGIRVPPTSFDGAVSIDTLPQALVQRVDIVTGGASAVYGSDALVGVVNLILDTKFEGLKMNAQYGISERGDNANYRLSLTGGIGLLDDRLRLIGSVERNVNDGIGRLDDRPLSASGLNYCTLGTGTAASPFAIASGCHSQVATYGGLIPNSTAGSTAQALRGRAFLPDGTLAPFVAGTAGGIGGEGSVLPTSQALIVPLATWQAFGRASFEISDNIRAFTQVAWAKAVNGPWDHGGANFTAGSVTGLTVFSGNAFLAPSVQALLGPNDSFQVGRWSDNEAAQLIGRTDFPNPRSEQVARNTLVIAGLEGDFAKGWKWSANYTHGAATFDSSTYEPSPLKIFAATDAVRDGSGNIVCRVTLTNPDLYPGCAPLNPFGVGAPSAAALAYVQDYSRWHTESKLDSVSANISGKPFSTWAGPVSFAIGAEYRKQSLILTSNSDPAVPLVTTGIRPTPTVKFNTVNVGVVDGSVEVKEAYGELLVPLARDMTLLRSLDVSAAYRHTDYSTSGGVNTWKVGIDYAPFNDLRLRGTISRDIRAPNLFELFAGEQRSPRVTVDPHTGVSSLTQLLSSGNAELTPEIGDTKTFGAVYRPSWLSGFGISVDAYQIKISDAISSIDAATALTACESSGGAGPTCALITRPLTFSDRSAGNFPISIRSQPINVAVLRQKGIDFEVNYRSDVGRIFSGASGSFEIRGFASHLYGYYTDLGTGTAGSVQESAGYRERPKWRGTISTSYDGPVFGVFLQERFTGSYKMAAYRDIATGLDSQFFADHGKAPNYAYTDMTLTAKPNGPQGGELFLTVNNLFDKQAPLLFPSGNNSVNLYYPTIRTSYDIVGRAFTAGVRLKF